jgi:low affinity Fe/Cu permease
MAQPRRRLRKVAPRPSVGRWLERLSSAVGRWTGSASAFGCAVGVVLIWAALGPVFGYSNTWQLVVNTGTTIVTFLMVFLLQRAQNKDALAIQLKLDELVAAIEGASNRLIDVESLDEDELTTLRTFYGELARLAKRDVKLSASHSVEEARTRHAKKR